MTLQEILAKFSIDKDNEALKTNLDSYFATTSAEVSAADAKDINLKSISINDIAIIEAILQGIVTIALQILKLWQAKGIDKSLDPSAYATMINGLVNLALQLAAYYSTPESATTIAELSAQINAAILQPWE